MAGATGFEPAVSCVTGRCVEPGYTTPPNEGILPHCALYVSCRQWVNDNQGYGLAHLHLRVTAWDLVPAAKLFDRILCRVARQLSLHNLANVDPCPIGER